jgi:Fe-S-cluster-containing dehydrogenase component
MKGFLLDLNRCTGCHACMLACTIENELGQEKSWREVYTFNLQRRPSMASFHLSLGCLHCADPACMRSCPALAYARDPSTGAMLIDTRLCIGCKYCNWVCPFDAPRYNRSTRTISKCTLCNHRLIEGGNPACVSLCPTGALQFVELLPPPGTEAVPGFPVTGIGPAIRFVPLRSASGPEVSPELCQAPVAAGLQTPDPASTPKVSVESEWSLIGFTLAAALLVAIAGAALLRPLRIDGYDFLIAALGTIGVGTLHLGRRLRAWRAVLNLRHSWLSREIFFYAIFVALTATGLFLPSAGKTLGWAGILSGFAALFCVDRVYDSVATRSSVRFHSAGAVLTGLFLSGILAGSAPLAGLAGLTKLVLYADRQPWSGSSGRLFASVLRLGLGFVAPLALWHVYPGWVLPAVVVGEVIDRCEYYLDLDLITPRNQIALDLKENIAAIRNAPGRYSGT